MWQRMGKEGLIGVMGCKRYLIHMSFVQLNDITRLV